jgi:hypothetical protein
MEDKRQGKVVYPRTTLVPPPKGTSSRDCCENPCPGRHYCESSSPCNTGRLGPRCRQRDRRHGRASRGRDGWGLSRSRKRAVDAARRIRAVQPGAIRNPVTDASAARRLTLVRRAHPIAAGQPLTAPPNPPPLRKVRWNARNKMIGIRVAMASDARYGPTSVLP